MFRTERLVRFRPRQRPNSILQEALLKVYKTFRVEHFVETEDKAFRTKLLLDCFALHLILALHSQFARTYAASTLGSLKTIPWDV